MQTRDFSVLLCLLTVSPASRAQLTPCGLDYHGFLRAPDYQPEDRYGWIMAMDGDVLVIGAPYSRNGDRRESGRVYVYHLNPGAKPGNPNDDSWHLITTFLGPNQYSFNRFGSAVDVNRDTFAVGVGNDFADELHGGSVYVYTRDSAGTPDDPLDDAWHRRATLTASDAQHGDYFGSSVSLSGEHLVVVARLARDPTNVRNGAAYVFRRDRAGTPMDTSDDSWVEQTKINSNPPGFKISNGAVAIEENWLAISDPYVGTVRVGTVFLFRMTDSGTPNDVSDDAWIPHVSFPAPERHIDGRFGKSLAFDGDRLAVGMPGANQAGHDSGLAFVFRRQDQGTPELLSDDQWVLEGRLEADNPTPTDWLGETIDINGELVIAGAYGRELSCLDPPYCLMGAAYAFRRNDGGTPADPTDDQWQLHDKLIAPKRRASGNFGWTVATNGTFAAAGYGNIYSGDYNGAVELFAPGIDCDGNGLLDGCELMAHATPDCDDNAVPDACDMTSGREADCNANVVLDICDIHTHVSDDCNQNRVPDECDLSSAQATDCNWSGVLDECEIYADFRLDCNNSRILDSCELADGTEFDCDASSVLDSCEITDTPPRDCDYDGALDTCLDSKSDCNSNQVPDSCEAVLRTSRLTSVPKTEEYDEFGWSLAVNRDWIAAGASRDSEMAPNSGAVHLFRRSDGGTAMNPEGGSWVHAFKITGPTTSAGDSFGTSLRMDANRLAISAPGDSEWGDAVGAVFVYRRNGGPNDDDSSDDSWVLEQKLVPSDPKSSRGFGAAMDMDGRRMVVGAPGYSNLGGDALYVFELKNPDDPLPWSQTARIAAAELPGKVRFSGGVALRGDFVAVGGGDARVYVLQRSGGSEPPWALISTIQPPPDVSHFGRQLSLESDLDGLRLLISGSQSHAPESVVLLYRGVRKGDTGAMVWQVESDLTPAVALPTQAQPPAVDLNGERAVLAVHPSYVYYGNFGLTHVHRLQSKSLTQGPSGAFWQLEAMVGKAQVDPGDYLARSVSLYGTTLVIGGGTVSPPFPTAVYVYNLATQDCNGNQVPDSCDLRKGVSGDGNANAIPDECERSGNCDGDADVDRSDAAQWLRCFMNAAPVATDSDCRCADRDLDGDIDLQDWYASEELLSSP